METEDFVKMFICLAGIGVSIGLSVFVYRKKQPSARGLKAISKNDPFDIKMQKLADEAVLEAERCFQIILDYTENSIKNVDVVLRKLQSSIENDKPETSEIYAKAVFYGAYVGETIRKYSGGIWVENKEFQGPVGYAIRCKGIEMFPIRWCYMILTEDKDDTVMSKYSCGKVLVKESNKIFDPNMKEIHADGIVFKKIK